MYAGRKRRKPLQKGTKLTPTEGDKSNPSKRHRDRLNSELDRLAGLLPFPEDVISSLDKLSILRLSVSYIRTKRFLSVALKKHPSNGMSQITDHHDCKVPEQTARCVPEGELLLEALSGFVLVITAEGIIFYCSHTIQDYLGFHQTDVMNHSVLELIHTEDQEEFKRNLDWALKPSIDLGSHLDITADGESASSYYMRFNPDELPPENSSFLERCFVCRFRCLLDNSSGFLALSIQGRLKFLHVQSELQCANIPGAPLQLALFAVATPLQSPAILEIRTKNMIFRTKHKLDFTPMACDAKGKIVLGYTEAELRVRGSGYQFIHAADMLHCAENHVRMIKTGESGLTVFRLLTKDNRWKWVQANARLVYKNGKPDYIIATQRPLVDEEGGEHLRKRAMHLPFTFATGEALLYQTGNLLYGFPEPLTDKAKGKKGIMEKKFSEDGHPKSLLEALMSQDQSVYVCQPDSEAHMSCPCSTFGKQQGETAGFGNGSQMMAICNSEKSMCDPLLTTLDSLSLDGEETCSNSELLSALENLGLNAEDLEVLLLDEKMIAVEMDSRHIATLCELTNNDILSEIHDSFESLSNREEHNDFVGFGLYDFSSYSAQSGIQQVQAHCVPTTPATPSFSGQAQQLPSSTGGLRFLSGSVDSNILSGNNHWMLMTEKDHHHDNHTPRHSFVNEENKNTMSTLNSSEHWQEEQMENSLTLLPNFQNLDSTFTPSKHTAFLQDVDNIISNTAHAGGQVLNGTNLCPYDHLLDNVEPAPLEDQQSHKLQNLPLYTSLAPSQTAALELEQLVTLAQPSVEAYSLFNTSNTTQGAHNQLENGCLLNVANATFIRTCLMSNGKREVAGNIQISCTDGLPDTQKSGFII
ncbi:aryl hydrocarbon receptor-like isoform X2 [Corythoichthys intestinalis]|uniref:aryl hydrocarbon receptor-like isoform X2 n=1 Tax=Corythoichthys intestinalis TaxID=161448 RepID=UPI0025A50984|nr:aryl hydrocarbon receptor-like isoform X2 [Corythoichthys intestinalis]